MTSYVLARVIHIIAIVVWIGGVAMVTAVILPAVRAMKSTEEGLKSFEEIEGRFALIAKFATLLAGLSGFYMLYATNSWDRYLHIEFWWIHAMTLIWLIFTIVLFILEPYVLNRLFGKLLRANPKRAFKLMHRAHWVLLILSLITMAGAVAGSHGWFWI